MNPETAWTAEAALGELLLTRQMAGAAELQAIVDAKRASYQHQRSNEGRRAYRKGRGLG